MVNAGRAYCCVPQLSFYYLSNTTPARRLPINSAFEHAKHYVIIPENEPLDLRRLLVSKSRNISLELIACRFRNAGEYAEHRTVKLLVHPQDQSSKVRVACRL